MFLQQALLAVSLNVLTMLRLVVQAVSINGRRYDVGVRLARSNKVLLLVEHIEDVEPPGMLRQACEAKAQCPGYIEDMSTGVHWPSSFPLDRRGWYIFTPRPSLHGMSMIIAVLTLSGAGFAPWNGRSFLRGTSLAATCILCLTEALGGCTAQLLFTTPLHLVSHRRTHNGILALFVNTWACKHWPAHDNSWICQAEPDAADVCFLRVCIFCLSAMGTPSRA